MVYTLVYTYSDINTHHFVIIIHIIGSLYIYIVNGINMYVYIYIHVVFGHMLIRYVYIYM
jgi:hypothetical protein